MNEIDERFIAWWGERRKIGKWKYGLKHGVLMFALPVYTATELFRFFTQRQGEYEWSLTRIVIGIAVWSLLGLLSFGLIQWQMLEKRYHKLQKQNSRK